MPTAQPTIDTIAEDNDDDEPSYSPPAYHALAVALEYHAHERRWCAQTIGAAKAARGRRYEHWRPRDWSAFLDWLEETVTRPCFFFDPDNESGIIRVGGAAAKKAASH